MLDDHRPVLEVARLEGRLRRVLGRQVRGHVAEAGDHAERRDGEDDDGDGVPHGLTAIRGESPRLQPWDEADN